MQEWLQGNHCPGQFSEKLQELRSKGVFTKEKKTIKVVSLPLSPLSKRQIHFRNLCCQKYESSPDTRNTNQINRVVYIQMASKQLLYSTSVRSQMCLHSQHVTTCCQRHKMVSQHLHSTSTHLTQDRDGCKRRIYVSPLRKRVVYIPMASQHLHT